MLVAALVLTSQPFGVIKEGLGIAPIGRGGRAAIQVDQLLAQVVNGRLDPAVGQQIGDRSWQTVNADGDGWFRRGVNGGYAAFRVESPSRQIVILHASGHSASWVNSVARIGDPYGYGWQRQPVVLEKGVNRLLFSSRRGGIRVEIEPSTKPAFLNAGDVTSPDFLVGEAGKKTAGIIVVNATDQFAEDLVIRCRTADSTVVHETRVPRLLPLECRKVPFVLSSARSSKPGVQKINLTLAKGKTVVDSTVLELRVRGPQDTLKRTFISDIDGSVQYYAVRPATDSKASALVLSLHGASVEASGQADAYSNKPWCNIVCPTNRRPYGFDWEEIGRLDALEVLADAARHYRPSRDQIYLTGHSMGGHGTWQIGANYPGSFAAIGPSAGWSTFFSYGGGVRYTNPSDVEKILNRSSNPSDTMELITNLSPVGVYILHGDADDNVPVSEARKMADALAPFHKDWQKWEQKGAGHWWENSDEPGAECMDWPPMYDLFARRRIPDSKERRQIDFSTFSPGITASLGWVGIIQQIHAFEKSRVLVDCEPFKGLVHCTTENISRLRFDITASPVMPGKRIEFQIDGQILRATPRNGIIFLARVGSQWNESVAPRPNEKGPARYGGFKDAFRNRVILVYGTTGSAAEAAWSLAKARYDAEAFGYVGNGAPEIMSDVEFLRSTSPDRNVIVYGNSDINAAWKALLSDSPIQVTRDAVLVGRTRVASIDLAAVFIRPRAGSAKASVAVVGGTGLDGLRMSERFPYFTSGAGFPDFLIASASALLTGTKGVLCAGYFGNDWTLGSGDVGWGALEVGP